MYLGLIKNKNFLGFIMQRNLFIRNNRCFIVTMENPLPRKFVSTAQVKQLRMKRNGDHQFERKMLEKPEVSLVGIIL
jgi:hypothetical protein